MSYTVLVPKRKLMRLWVIAKGPHLQVDAIPGDDGEITLTFEGNDLKIKLISEEKP